MSKGRWHSVSFTRIIKALQVAMPFSIAMRLKSFSHCAEVSLVGMRVLTAFGFRAEMLSTKVFAVSRSDNVALSLGASAYDVYKKTKFEVGEYVDFETWMKDKVQFADSFNGEMPHLIIAAERGSDVARLDLTVGQMRENQFARSVSDLFPLTLVWPGKEWPRLQSGSWTIWYEQSDRVLAPELKANLMKLDLTGFVADTLEMTKLAIQLNDEEAFIDELLRQAPAVMRDVGQLIQKLAGRAL